MKKTKNYIKKYVVNIKRIIIIIVKKVKKHCRVILL